jgi:drug/metabolite transporter (DMT)-like permease
MPEHSLLHSPEFRPRIFLRKELVVVWLQVKYSRSGLLCLLAVYLIWGSTFLAIRIAVSGAGAFAPYSLAAIRTGSAGLLLLLFALIRGHSLRVGWPALRWLALTGTLLWIGGHALVIWAEQRMDSGLAALIFASSPLWSVLLTGFSRGGQGKFPVLFGFLGVALVLPLQGPLVGGALFWDAAALLLSAFFWALGSLLGAGPAEKLPITVSTGLQLLTAGIVTALIAMAAGEARPAPDARALLACSYLIVFGTVLAYLAYTHILRTLPVSLVMSFAYVNPVVAVVLGALVLGEKIGARSLAGMLVVIVSVALLFVGRGREA